MAAIPGFLYQSFYRVPGIVFFIVPDPKLLITDLDLKNANQEFRILPLFTPRKKKRLKMFLKVSKLVIITYPTQFLKLEKLGKVEDFNPFVSSY